MILAGRPGAGYTALPMDEPSLANPSALYRSLLAGCIAGVGLGVALAYLSALPFMLGLFFSLLFGLIVGAIMYRLGQPAQPAGRCMLWSIGLFVVLLIWVTTLVVEYKGFAGDATRAVLRSLPQPLDDDQRVHLAAETRRFVLSEFIGEPVEGTTFDGVRAFPGYLWWIATDGEMDCPRVFDESSHPLALSQRRGGWLIRVALSLGLLTFAVLSQVLGLSAPAEESGASPDDENTLSEPD